VLPRPADVPGVIIVRMATTLLIVDDSETLRRAVREFCEKQGDLKIVGEASDGEEGIRKAVSLRPDVTVLDVRMPSMNGIETALILKRYLPTTYLILFTFYDDSISSRLSSMVGVDLIVSKSDGISALLAAIRRRKRVVKSGEDSPRSDRQAKGAGR
jgi:DNA-binding NarL/FixJ family response regulator